MSGWSRAGAATLLDALDDAGLHAVHPAMGRIHGTGGDPIETDRATLIDRMALPDRTGHNFWLWLDSGRPVRCRVVRDEQVVIQEFSLSELDRPTARFVANAVVALSGPDDPDLVGVVIDFSGEFWRPVS